jgi:hypothetical protein
MYTSIALLAMCGAWMANIPVTPSWERDYNAARQIVEKAHKPLAVFMGSGDVNWQQLTREGKPDAEIAKLLSEQFVRLYVNTETADGRKFAASFGLTGSRGLIISNRTGDLQAFRHEGDLAAQDVARHLTRYGSPDHVVSVTEGNAPVAAPTNVYQPPSFDGFGVCRT